MRRTGRTTPEAPTLAETVFAEPAPVDVFPSAPAIADPAAPNPATDAPDMLAFAAVPVRPRHDGWTAEKQQAFIEGLADTGSVTKAALGVFMSPDSAYRLRRRADAGEFDKAWEAALAVATRRLVDVAFERAIDGVENPVFHKGEVVGLRRTVSDRLLMFLLKHHDPLIYGNLSGPLPYDATPADVRGPRIRRFPDLLARLGLGGAAGNEARAESRSESRASSRRSSRLSGPDRP
jgi:hypothetical protein